MNNFKISIVRPDPNGDIRLDTQRVSMVKTPWPNSTQTLWYEVDGKYAEVLGNIRTFVFGMNGAFLSLFALDGLNPYIAINNLAHAIAELYCDYPWISDPNDIHVQTRKELENLIGWLSRVGAAFPLEQTDLKVMVERGNNYHYRV